MAIIGVYKITNPNGRIYIGSSIDVERRIKNYKNLNKGQRQRKLYNSFQKNGFENHKFEIICQCLIENLYDLERYYGELYNCTSSFNLNCQLPKTGDKKILISEETKIRISECKKGEKHWAFGKKMKEDSKLKISRSHTGKKHTQSHKDKVSLNNASSRLVIDLNTGFFYNSVTDLHKYYNKFSRSYLIGMLNGNRINKTSFIYA